MPGATLFTLLIQNLVKEKNTGAKNYLYDVRWTLNPRLEKLPHIRSAILGL